MSEENIYSAPKTDVTPEQSEFCEVGPFKRGRIGRLRYVGYQMLSCLSIIIPIAIFVLIRTVAGDQTGLYDTHLIAMGVVTVFYIALLIVQIFLMVRRCHDLGQSGWASLAYLLIPFAALYLVFGRGDDNTNQYGAPPPENPRWLGPVVIGIMVVFTLLILGNLAMQQPMAVN